MGLLRRFFIRLSESRTAARFLGKVGMRLGFARRFVAGETLDEGLAAAKALNDQGFLVSLNCLGESVTSADEARAAARNYVAMLDALRERGIRGNISSKPTQLGLLIDADLCRGNMETVVRRAAELGNTVEFDMEASNATEPTLRLFAELRRRHPNMGAVLQSYLRRSEEDLRALKTLDSKVKVRIVKGAYLEPPTIAFPRKEDVDKTFARMLAVALDGSMIAAVATHDERLVDLAIRLIRERGLKPGDYEFQFVYGVRRDLQARVLREGFPVRVYLPYGTQWCPYFLRRLAERPANVGFIARAVLVEPFRRRR